MFAPIVVKRAARGTARPALSSFHRKAPAAAAAAPPVAVCRFFSTAREATRQDLADVAAATENWLRAVTGQKPTSPAETSALYAQDAVLWATVSPQLRVTPREIQDYFEVFARLPQLTITNYKPYIRVYGDVAINDGYYTVSFAAPDGTKITKARYVFVYKRNPKTSAWEIIDHHSSAMPVAPAGLRRATTFTPPGSDDE